MSKTQRAGPFPRRGAEPQLFFATNRANIITLFTSGLIRAREGLEKYYDDLLRHCLGRIPLWFRGCPLSLLTELSGSQPGLFPVLVELEQKGLLGEDDPVLAADLTVHRWGDMGADERPLCVLPIGPIPIGAVKALHFRERGERDDFNARAFDNALGLPNMEVTSGVFTPGGPSATEIVAALKNISGERVPRAVPPTRLCDGCCRHAGFPTAVYGCVDGGTRSCGVVSCGW